jgi:hypothetical protein
MSALIGVLVGALLGDCLFPYINHYPLNMLGFLTMRVVVGRDSIGHLYSNDRAVWMATSDIAVILGIGYVGCSMLITFTVCCSLQFFMMVTYEIRVFCLVKDARWRWH